MSAGSTVPATSNSLRIIDPSAGQTCNTTPGVPAAVASIAWNQSGPQGPPGLQGPPGPPGKSVTVTGGNTLTIGGSVVTVGAPSGVTINTPPVSPNSPPVGSATVSGLGSFNILSLGLGGSNPTSRAAIHDLVITKTVDKSSPLLFQACASGKHFPKAILRVRKGGKPYLQYTLNNVLVSSYQQSGHGSAKPTETLTINYSEIKFTYTK